MEPEVKDLLKSAKDLSAAKKWDDLLVAAKEARPMSISFVAPAHFFCARLCGWTGRTTTAMCFTAWLAHI